MKKKNFYLMLSVTSVVFALISLAFVAIFRLNIGVRTFILQNICGENNIDLTTCGKIETGIFDYLGNAYNTYLNFESGPLHYIPMALIPIFIVTGVVFLVLSIKAKK